MRILCFSTWYPFPPNNGAELRAYHLLKALAQRHAVTVVAFRWGDRANTSSYGPLPPNIELRAVDTDPYRYVDLPAVAKYVSPIPLAFWPSRAMRKAIQDLDGAAQWDAIVAFQSPVVQYAMSLPGPKILDMDTALSFWMYDRVLRAGKGVSRLRAFISWQKAHRYETSAVRRSQAVTVVSERELSFVQSMTGSTPCRVVVVPNGVNTTHNRPGLLSPLRHRLVYNGALGYSANYDAMRFFLAEIYPLVKHEVADVSMVITGSTRNVDLSGLALDDSVILTGYVDDVRVPVTEATVSVVPLREGGGTRLKILEAMALGTPVVATSKGAEGLNVVDGEHCLICDSPEAFAARTVALLQDAELRRHLAANARRLVEAEYDWDRIGLQFSNLIEETVDIYGARMSQDD